MGCDGYEREVVSVAPSGGGGGGGASNAMKSSSTFHDDLRPMKRNIKCNAGTPIVLALDISGSMNEWPRIFFDKLPMFYGQMVMQDYVPDPALSFAAFSGGYQLQATDFVQKGDCDVALQKMYMSAGGGDGEPYADAAYFYASDMVQFGPDVKGKPYFFFTGDEVMGSFGQQLEKNVKSSMDPDAQGPFDDLQGLWDKLKEKYHVFLVEKPGAAKVHPEWVRILGEERVLTLKTPKAVVDCILGAIAVNSGARTLEEYREDLKERQQSEERQIEVVAALQVMTSLAPSKDAKASGYTAEAAPSAAAEPKDGDCNDYPNISYGAAMPERLASEKMEKKMKKVVKEGGKRGVEIEGAADMGGLEFFCTTMEEPNGDVDLLYESMRAMNAKSDPNEEERKGGSGRIGKMLISKDQADSKLALVAYVPPAKQDQLSAGTWMDDIIKTLGGGQVLFKDATTAKAVIENDADKGLFVLKLKDSAITESINYLKGKGLFPDKVDDSDDEFVFGDDDFPS